MNELTEIGQLSLERLRQDGYQMRKVMFAIKGLMKPPTAAQRKVILGHQLRISIR